MTPSSSEKVKAEVDIRPLSISSEQTSTKPSEEPENKNALDRRESRILYAEKYGLNTPEWSQSSQTEEAVSDDSDDDRPIGRPMAQACVSPPALAPIRPLVELSSPSVRPVSMRNVAHDASTTRPRHFVKAVSYSSKQTDAMPSGMRLTHILFERYRHKVYMEGFLRKRLDGNTWASYYVELCGPVLFLWNAEEELEEVLPQYINVTDADIQLENPDQYMFALNTSKSNRYILQAPGPVALTMWINVIRLSCYEISRLHEIFTSRLLFRPRFSQWIGKPVHKREGYLDVRFSGDSEWKKYWVVVTDRREEKKLFGKKLVPWHGQCMLYATKGAKYPESILMDVTQAYILYPETPQLLDHTVLFKIHGSLHSGGSKGNRICINSFASIHVMASCQDEMIQWLVSVFDAFKLYGRPSSLLNNTSNEAALNLGEHIAANNPRLFLEKDDVCQAPLQETLRQDNRALMSRILVNKLRQPQSPRPAPFSRNSSRTVSSRPSTSRQDRRPMSTARPVSSIRVNQSSKVKTTYASDESTDETASDDQNDSDSSCSSPTMTPTRPAQTPTPSHASIAPMRGPLIDMIPDTQDPNAKYQRQSALSISALPPTPRDPSPRSGRYSFNRNSRRVSQDTAGRTMASKEPHINGESGRSSTFSMASMSASSHSSHTRSRSGESSSNPNSGRTSRMSQQPWGPPRYGQPRRPGDACSVVSDTALRSSMMHSNTWETMSVDSRRMMQGSGIYHGMNGSVMSEGNLPLSSNTPSQKLGRNKQSPPRSFEDYARATGQPLVKIPDPPTDQQLPSNIGVKSKRPSLRQQRPDMDPSMYSQQPMMTPYMMNPYMNPYMMTMGMPWMFPAAMPMMDPRFSTMPVCPFPTATPFMWDYPVQTSGNMAASQESNNGNDDDDIAPLLRLQRPGTPSTRPPSRKQNVT